MKYNKKCILVIFIFSVIIMVVGGVKGYIEAHDSDFHFSTIKAIVEELSVEKALVQEPLKFMADGLRIWNKIFLPTFATSSSSIYYKVFRTFWNRIYYFWNENYSVDMFFCIWNYIFLLIT